MGGLRKIIVWFLVCLVLAIYARVAGFTLRQTGNGLVLGQHLTAEGK